MASDLRETIPTFGQGSGDEQAEVSLSNWSALSSMSFARNGWEALVIALVAVGVIGGIELWVRALDIKPYWSVTHD